MKVIATHINVIVFDYYSILDVREVFEHEFEGKMYTQDDEIWQESYPIDTEGWQDIMKDVSYFQHKYNVKARFFDGKA